MVENYYQARMFSRTGFLHRKSDSRLKSIKFWQELEKSFGSVERSTEKFHLKYITRYIEWIVAVKPLINLSMKGKGPLKKKINNEYYEENWN